MHAWMLYRNTQQILRAGQESLVRAGHLCDFLAFESTEQINTALEKADVDVIVSSEIAVLSKLTTAVRAKSPTVFLSPEFFCAQRMSTAKCDRYLIPHESLSFDFINAGAPDRLVRVCGIPVSEKYGVRLTKSDGCAALGLRTDMPIFLLLADGVSANELKGTVRAAETLCPAVQILILCSDTARVAALQSRFAQTENVFVSQSTAYESIGLSVADAVFTAAYSLPVCAAAQRGKNLVLLHTAVPRARKNAAFLDRHGVAFSGKTAADNVSYACRLLESQRLRGLMTDAQEKYILSNANNQFVKIIEELIIGKIC